MTGKMVRTLPLPVILLMAGVLRFYRLAGQSLWADEGNSVALAHRSFAEIAQRTAFDIHPPLYYWLLKVWIVLFGDSEIGLRSLSAVLGVGLVYLIWQMGRRLFGQRVGLLAAVIAAVSPFQLYYAQEARMYMLLTVLGLVTITAAIQWLTPASNQSGYTNIALAGGYVIATTAGLYTHYAFPLILIAVNGGALMWLWRHPPKLGRWFGLHVIPLFIYLPWLPIAWRQLTTWPAEPQTASLPDIFQTISTTLVVGLAWPFQQEPLIATGLVLTLLTTTFAAVKICKKSPSLRPVMAILWLWFLLPVILTVIIFSPAFLKFLLVAAPPLALLTALAVDYLVSATSRHNIFYPTRLAGGILLLVWLGLSATGLVQYYTNPQYARDNYRGIVNFIKAVGRPTDAVILNAEGQQDVFSYYYHRPPAPTAPVYPLPQQRPLDKTATIATLSQIADNAEKVYAVYWATQQADPDGVIEGWLNNHLFKAFDRWYGNVRLVGYANLQQPEAIIQKIETVRLGESIRLTGFGAASTAVAAGDILQIGLTWQTTAPLPDDYTVFLQLLDAANHLVGQRDAPPLTPTSTWPPNQTIVDRHGLFVEPGTPPGPHRLIAGLYHSQTGQRLPVSTGGNFIELGTVGIIRPETPLPPEAFDIQHPYRVALGAISLVGYDLYKLGYRSAPNSPLHPGDPLHLTLYWQANRPTPATGNNLRLEIVSSRGEKTGLAVETTPAGVDYPVSAWQAGEIVRGQFDMFLSGIEPGAYRVVINLGDEQIVTEPFWVED